MRNTILFLISAIICIQFTACTNGGAPKATADSTVSVQTEQTTKELVEPEEHGTTNYVDYLYFKAKEDALHATDEELQAALDWLKENVNDIFSSQLNMELAMYKGQLLEHKFRKTKTIHEKIGWQAYKTVKYVYRGVDGKDDEVTINNYDELKYLLTVAPDII